MTIPDNHQKPAILLACKSRHTVKLIGRHLQDYFSLMAVEDAEQAWEMLLENRDISLAVFELGLSNDTFGLIERVREAQDSRLAAIPILLLVGETDRDEEREVAFKNGATDFINLPFASSELIARVRLHANIYVQHSAQPSLEMQQVSAVNVLQQLSQENFFNSRAQQEISFSQRHRTNISLCKLKLDNIKAIMSGFDKATAISVVQAVARIIQETLRREDSLCYLGNAEFRILYPATNGIGATTGVNRILQNIASRKIKIAGKQVPVSLSGAVFSCIAGEDLSLERAYQSLDHNLAQAISEGGNKIISSLPPVEEKTPSIDRALKLIRAGKSDELKNQVDELLAAIIPLIELADSERDYNLDPMLQLLKDELNSDSGKADEISVSI